MKSRWVEIVLFVVGGMLVLVIGPYFFNRALAGAPHESDPKTGHVLYFNNHGSIVYLSWHDELIDKGTAAAGLVILAVAGAMSQRRTGRAPFQRLNND